MKQFIVEYLQSPDSNKAATIEKLSTDPEESFEVLLNFQGPWPKNLHPQDAPDYLSELLTGLLLKFPRLLIDRDISKMSSGSRYFLVSSAIATESPIFAPVILHALKDRVADKRLLAVKAVARFKFLQTLEAKCLLQSLLTLKSMAYCREEIQRALEVFDDSTEEDG